MKQKSARAPHYSMSTSSFNKSVQPKKPVVRARSKKKAVNQALAEADQIMLDLIKGTAGSQNATNMEESDQPGKGQIAIEESKIVRNKAPIRSQQMCSNMPQGQK